MQDRTATEAWRSGLDKSTSQLSNVYSCILVLKYLCVNVLVYEAEKTLQTFL